MRARDRYSKLSESEILQTLSRLRDRVAERFPGSGERSAGSPSWMKRRRALGALHQLRSVVHIVDMHQLTKDPERLMSPQPDTASSPERRMSAPELGRYLDYCSELVSLASKIAALLVQRFDDPVVLGAVNEIETLATGLSGKVGQKITLLERATSRDRDAFAQPRNGG
jgi:hypothetical protein